MTPVAFRRELSDNWQDAVRLVGFFEYGRALQLFERLFTFVSPEERQVIDEIIRQEPQYTIYVNQFATDPRAANSAFRPAAAGESDNARRGLEWVVALARLEYGAIVAAYTLPEVPFPTPSPGDLDADAFRELLLESALLHAWALERDAIAISKQSIVSQNERPQFTPKQLFALERRLTLTWKMLQVINGDAQFKMTDPQRQEFRTLTAEINSLRNSLRQKVLNLGSGVGRIGDSGPVP